MLDEIINKNSLTKIKIWT